VHGWRGRMAYELLAAADYLMQSAIQLLMHGNLSYIREKLQSGLRRLTGALYEGIRESDTPAMFNFKTTYFPDEKRLTSPMSMTVAETPEAPLSPP